MFVILYNAPLYCVTNQSAHDEFVKICTSSYSGMLPLLMVKKHL